MKLATYWTNALHRIVNDVSDSHHHLVHSCGITSPTLDEKITATTMQIYKSRIPLHSLVEGVAKSLPC